MVRATSLSLSGLSGCGASDRAETGGDFVTTCLAVAEEVIGVRLLAGVVVASRTNGIETLRKRRQENKTLVLIR